MDRGQVLVCPCRFCHSASSVPDIGIGQRRFTVNREGQHQAKQGAVYGGKRKKSVMIQSGNTGKGLLGNLLR